MDGNSPQNCDSERGRGRRSGNHRGGRGASRGRGTQRNHTAGRSRNALHTAAPVAGTPPGLAMFSSPSSDAPLSDSAPGNSWQQSREYQTGNHNRQQSARGQGSNMQPQDNWRQRAANAEGSGQASRSQHRNQAANGQHSNSRRSSTDHTSTYMPIRNNVVPIPSQYVSTPPSGSYNNRGSQGNKNRYAESPQGRAIPLPSIASIKAADIIWRLSAHLCSIEAAASCNMPLGLTYPASKLHQACDESLTILHMQQPAALLMSLTASLLSIRAALLMLCVSDHVTPCNLHGSWLLSTASSVLFFC